MEQVGTDVVGPEELGGLAEVTCEARDAVDVDGDGAGGEFGPNPTLTLVANSIPCLRGRLQRGESGATGPGYRPPRPPVIEPHHIDRRCRQEVLEMRLRLPDIATPT